MSFGTVFSLACLYPQLCVLHAVGDLWSPPVLASTPYDVQLPSSAVRNGKPVGVGGRLFVYPLSLSLAMRSGARDDPPINPPINI